MLRICFLQSWLNLPTAPPSPSIRPHICVLNFNAICRTDRTGRAPPTEGATVVDAGAMNALIDWAEMNRRRPISTLGSDAVRISS